MNCLTLRRKQRILSGRRDLKRVHRCPARLRVLHDMLPRISRRLLLWKLADCLDLLFGIWRSQGCRHLGVSASASLGMSCRRSIDCIQGGDGSGRFVCGMMSLMVWFVK